MQKTKLTGRSIDAMTPAERQKLMDDLDAETPESRRKRFKPVTDAEKERAIRVGKAMGPGRPKLGKGTRVVSVTVEVDLLERADAYAARQGMKRSELFTAGLRRVLPKKAG